MKGLQNRTETERIKGICQQPFCAIANYVVARRLSFARSCILAENTQFRSSQQTQSGETLAETFDNIAHNTTFLKYSVATNCENYLLLKEKNRCRNRSLFTEINNKKIIYKLKF